MKICIDGLPITHLKGTGLYSYTYELLHNLLEIYPQPQYEVLWDHAPPINFEKKYSNLFYENLELNRKENDYSLLEQHITDKKVNIYHSPNNGFSIPSNKVSKYIMTVHDLFPMKYREYVDEKYLSKFMAVFPDSLKKCDKIIAVSNSIKKDLEYFFHVPGEKIHVIYPGCSERFAPMEMESCREVLKNRYNIGGDYIVSVGSVHIRKNLPVLLKAFKKVINRAQGLKLVIAGNCGGKRENYYLQLKNLCRQLGIEDSVIFTGTVDYAHMPCLYNGALCAVSLSLYEGLPMSTIEAAACGVPVICSNLPCFEEAAGDGAVYVEPENENAVSNLILKAIEDRAYREKAVKMGKKMAAKYNWDSSIKKLINIYESIAYGN